MRIKMLDTVEDANNFTDAAELSALPTSRCKITREDKDREGQVVGGRRIDKLFKDEIVEVPDWQAKNLINLEYAEKV